jgi:transcriptional regulator with XRE-family HTH domain
MNRIREMREIRKIGFSQYHLAALSGIVQNRISLIERGLVKPSKAEMEKISTALGAQVQEVFPENVQRDSHL